jgi:hypothetical protein
MYTLATQNKQKSKKIMTKQNQEKLDKPVTDVELSKKLSDAIYENYRIALEFIETNPDYSLLQFRKINERVINIIANKYDIKLKDNDPVGNIEDLFKHDFIIESLNDNLHDVRKLCNPEMHVDNNNESDKTNKILTEKASTVRKKIIKIFEDIYFIMDKNKPIPIDLAPIGQQQYRETIYDALVSTDFKQKLKAGIICEDILKAQFYSAPIIETNNVEFHLKGLRKSALSFYEAAYKISAQMDDKSYSSAKEKETEIFKKCELEPLYKYANLGLLIKADDKNYKKALKAAANRGYVPARALLGAIFYKEKKYKLAFSYLSSVESKDEGRALLYLFYYYNEGFAPVKIKSNKALKYLKRAIELDYPDALAILSEVYLKNKIIKKQKNCWKNLLN